MKLPFVHNDGGRAKAGYKAKNVDDCVCRAICIGTGKPYAEVYAALNELAKSERRGKRKRSISHARNGVHKRTYHRYLLSLGWQWTPTMQIGQGCKVHLAPNEIPMKGTLIVAVSKHLTCVIDGVINDTFDPQRETTVMVGGPDGKAIPSKVSRRCVYGYFTPPPRERISPCPNRNLSFA